MSLFELIAVSSSPSLIAGVCLLLQAWCLLIEVKDRKGFWLAGTLLAQFAFPVLVCWLLREGILPPLFSGVLLGYVISLTAAAGVLAALAVLAVNRHRIPDLTVYSLWGVAFAGCTCFLQGSAYASFLTE